MVVKVFLVMERDVDPYGTPNVAGVFNDVSLAQKEIGEDRRRYIEPYDLKAAPVAAFLVYEEVSDQYGTSRVVGVFLSREEAELAKRLITTQRTYVTQMPIGALVGASR